MVYRAEAPGYNGQLFATVLCLFAVVGRPEKPQSCFVRQNGLIILPCTHVFARSLEPAGCKVDISN